MDKRIRALPGLDLIRGFEAAARHLSFTRAGEELFLTQSAVSRQIQALERSVGVALFTRRNRGLALTEAGEDMYRAAGEALRTLAVAMERIAPGTRQNMVTVTSSIAFCSLWLIPRLARFHKLQPTLDVRVAANNQILDLDRERIDVAIRYCPVGAAPAGAIRIFGEEIVPVCSPALLRDQAHPLRVPADLRQQVLLHFDDVDRSIPSLSWNVWLEAAGIADLKPAASLRFSHYDQVVNAALGGQGVALGRRPLVRNLIADGSLVMPFPQASVVDRAYYIVRTAATSARSEVDDFVQWLITEGAETAAGDPPTPGPRRKTRTGRSKGKP
jgi:LysR family transcriptional regulator, glycine cleavage system transcriptional activator